MKDKINALKEAWKHPGKKAGIKLLAYIIFFVILLLSAAVSSRVNNNNINQTTTTKTTTVVVDKYSKKQFDLLTNKYNVNYIMNINNVEYKINGTLNNNIVNGYLETNNDIKKIIIKDNNLYEIINDKEIELDIINKDYLSINYIINLIKQNSAVISDNNNIKTYSYNIDEIKVIVSTNETMITKIEIANSISNYLLNFDK